MFGVVAVSGSISNLTINGLTISGKGNVGGLVGKNFGLLSGCAFNGAVNGDMWTGGLVGWNEGEISLCYSTGSVASIGNTAGGTVYSSYWDKESCCLNSSCNSDPAFDLTSELMKNQNSFSGWNFNNCWQIQSATAISYPYLTNNLPATLPGLTTLYTLTYTTDGHGTISGTATQSVIANGSGSAVTAVPNSGFKFLNWSDNSTTNPRTDTNVMANLNLIARFASVFSAGSGTTDDPYQIVTAADFNNVRLFSGTTGAGVHFKLMNDLDLTGYLTSGEGFTAWGADRWLPICSSEQKFCARFDGNLFN